MADYNSGLPVRTEADGADERLHVKVVDGLTPANRMTVDTDLNAHVELHGNDPSGVDQVVRTSELGALTPDGLYSVSNNTKPGSLGLVVSQRAASPGDSDQIKKPTAITNSTVHALDISLHDELGAAYSDLNPLAVKISDSKGTIVQDYKDASAIAAASSDNHDYTVTAGKTLLLTQMEGSASGKAKFELQIETGVATGVFNNILTKFNSTADANVSVKYQDAPQVAAGVRVRVKITNKDNQAQDLYSTVIGHEI